MQDWILKADIYRLEKALRDGRDRPKPLFPHANSRALEELIERKRRQLRNLRS